MRFSLKALVIGVTLCCLGMAAVRAWGSAVVVAVAGLSGVELGLLLTTVLLVRLAGRLDQRGRPYASVAVGLVGMVPLVAALFTLILTVLFSIGIND